MNWQTVWILLIHELRMLVRDRRTVILSVALPLVTMPLILFAIRFMSEQRTKKLGETVYRYAVTGSQRDEVRALIERGQQAIAQAPRSTDESEASPADFKRMEVVTENPAAALRSSDVHFYLEGYTGQQADELREEPDPMDSGRLPGRTRSTPTQLTQQLRRLSGVPLIRIYFQADRDASRNGRSKMRSLLMVARQAKREELLRQKGLTSDPAKVFPIEDVRIASAGQVTGSWIGRFLTAFLMMFLLTGGSVVSLDIVAGEKERGSLETLLTTAARRAEIVAAKQLAIILVALTITFIQLGNLLTYVSLRLIPLPKDFVVEAPPLAILTLLVLFIPVSALVAAVLLIISAYARSYKEAQLYFFPVYLLSLVPPLAAALPGISLRSAIAVVPLANVSVAVREILVGQFDWPMILLTFVTTTLAAAWVVRASARLLSEERLITSSEVDVADLAGGPALFPKHVLRWYAVMGAILFAVAANVPALSTFRGQMIFNEFLLFLGLPFLMIWKYRLNVREVLALRPVKPVAWLAVLFLIPSTSLVGLGIFRLANLIVPVPRQMLEQFGRDLFPQDIPAWQLLFFISVFPGICEEISFRGTLLYGLRRRFHPAVLALAVGLIFGLFHVALFRIAPTAFIGIVLTTIVLLTGSIFPGMVAHAGNNAFAFWVARAGLSLADEGWRLNAAAVVIFALSFYILYRTRTPYPGLRPPTRK